MKKYLIAMLATATMSLAGCGMMSGDQMMMMEEMNGKMGEMSMQLNEIQFQVNSNAAAAASAKDMAQDAMVKASMMNMTEMPDSRRGMMMQKKMMK